MVKQVNLIFKKTTKKIIFSEKLIVIEQDEKQKNTHTQK